MIRGMGFGFPSVVAPQPGPYAAGYVLPTDVPAKKSTAVLKKPTRASPKKVAAAGGALAPVVARPSVLASIPRWAIVLGGLGLVAAIWYLTRGKKGGRRRGRRPFGG